MKRTIFSYFTLFVLLILTSCGSDSPQQDDTLPKIEFIGGDSSTSIVFDSSGGSLYVKFRASESWKVTIDGQESSNNWLSVSPSSGDEGLVTVTLIAGANEDTEMRNCKVVVTTPHDKAYIDVSQMQKDALVVSKSSYSLNEKGGDIEIEIGHNVDFDIRIDSDWITRSESRSYQTDKLVFHVAENTGYDNREGTITFTSKDKNIVQTVKVLQTSKINFVLRINGGNEQKGIANRKLHQPLQILAYIQNSDNTLTSLGTRYAIKFKILSGGGSLSEEQVSTDSNNCATTSWTLGTSGEQKVSVGIYDLVTKEFVTEQMLFTARIVTLSLSKISGDEQVAIKEQKLLLPLTVEILSSENFNVGSICAVKYTVASGGGKLDKEVVPIDNDNHASTTWVLGSNDLQKVTVSIIDKDTQENIGTPVIFSATIKENPKEPTAGLWIDLGLPSGIKWASHNVGATSPEGYGTYFAWGEMSQKSSYTEENSLTWRKSMGDISGNPQYDAAAAKWGGDARMPTLNEYLELVQFSTQVWIKYNGVNGRLVIGPNGNCIFLPSAGCQYQTSSDDVGKSGYYWSSTPYERDPRYTYCLQLGSDFFGYGCSFRSEGCPIRPVRN